jgi:methylmalonyl-CoA/ethylmalonyl-CoA epimerase
MRFGDAMIESDGDMIEGLDVDMITKIDHIGIAVKDLEAGLGTYAGALGLESVGTEEIPEQKVVVAMVMAGGVKIELLQPTQPDGPIAKFIGKRGEGIHHIAFRVRDIDGSLEKLESLGVSLIDKKPRTGAGGSRIAFLHPKGTHGVLVELVERKKE